MEVKLEENKEKEFCEDSKFIGVPSSSILSNSGNEQNVFRIRHSKSIGSSTIFQNSCKKNPNSAYKTSVNFKKNRKIFKMGKVNIGNSSLDYKDLKDKLKLRKTEMISLRNNASKLAERSFSSEYTYRTITNFQPNNE